MRYRMDFSYRGTDFYGYQVQDNKRTVQGEIETYLSKILNTFIRIYASGRTDRGVHALNQVATFDYDKDLECEKLRNSLNKLLPLDIHIKSINKCNDDFHARFSALGKQYIYLMAMKENDPFKNQEVFFSLKKYDIFLIKQAMNLFLGTHNFKNFCTNKEEESYEETIYDFTLKNDEEYLTFSIIGTGFKRYMVRMIIGTVLAYSLKKISLEEIKNKLDTEERNNVSFKAPPEGLYLKEVYYDEESLKNA